MIKKLGFAVLLLVQSGLALSQPSNRHQYGMGLIEDAAPVYRTFATVPRFRAFLPPEVDLSSRFPTPGNQGQQGSCTAWAAGYALRSYVEGRSRNWADVSAQALTFSPSYIYNQMQANGVCKGTAISKALDLLKTQGIAPMGDFPYSERDCSRQPNELVKDIASQYRIKGWRALDVSRLDNAKGRLAAGDPVIFGMRISESFMDLKGDAVYDDLDSPRIGAHAMVLVGYSEERQAFKLVNSWGTKWGSNGFGWVSYAALVALSQNQFVIEGAPASGPVPVVPPEPPKPTPAPVVLPEPPKPVQPPVVPTLEQTRTSVSALVAAVPCSRIAANVTADRAVQLAGFIGDASVLPALKAAIAGLPGVVRVQEDLQRRPWPQCEVLLNFAQTMASSRGLSISLLGGRGEKFRKGDSLVIEITTPSYPSYVYISYLQAGGEVVHLFQPEGTFPKTMPANTKLTFGGGSNGQPVYRIGPPFGDEIVVVTTSASPLFEVPLAAATDDRDYLTSFRRAFAERPKGGGGERVVSTVAATLRTQPK